MINKLLRTGITLVILTLALTLGADTASAATKNHRTVCTSSLIIYTDPADPGTITTTGPITRVRNSGVLGTFYTDILTGYTLDGSQEIVLNNITQKAQIKGSFVATGPEGWSITITYVGQADLATGQATGRFVASQGAGTLNGFGWTGVISAHLIGPASFDVTDTGPCFGWR